VEPLLLATALLGFAAAGASLGLLTGLIPGLHPNTIAVLLLASSEPLLRGLSAFFPSAQPDELALLLSALLLGQLGSHLLVELLPMVLLNVPAEENVLVALPAHRLVHRGLGAVALHASADGTMAGLLIGLLLLPLMAPLLGPPLDGFHHLRPIIPFVVGFLALRLILRERYNVSIGNGRRVRWSHCGLAAAVFLTSGMLGTLVLLGPGLAGVGRGPLGSAGEGREALLFPLFSGLFALPALLLSDAPKPSASRHVPHQRGARSPPLPLSSSHLGSRTSLLGALAGSLVGWLPGLTPAVAAAALPRLRTIPELPERSWILAAAQYSAISGSGMVFTVAAWPIIARTRSGTMEAVEALGSAGGDASVWLGSPWLQLPVLLFPLLLGAAIGYSAVLRTRHRAAAFLAGRKPRWLAPTVALGLLVTNGAFVGAFGLLISLTATPIGLLPLRLGVARAHLIGCLIVPVLIYALT